MVTSKNIRRAAKIAKLDGYTGNFTELGGGEINDTFLLDCGDYNAILRVARYVDQKSLKVEADTLSKLNLTGVPRLIFFDENQRIQNRHWIVESCMEGEHIGRLGLPQFKSLGKLLANIHAETSKNEEVNIWANFLKRRRQYGDEKALLNHPDERLRFMVRCTQEYVEEFQKTHNNMPCSIIHGDATPTNILIDDDELSLIDWEFSHFNDPMAEFSTIYYDDMDYNNGKWRIHITDNERDALFAGYREGGGVIDEERIHLWMNIDKLGASLYLYWRMHLSGRETAPEQRELYNRELEKLIASLQKQYL